MNLYGSTLEVFLYGVGNADRLPAFQRSFELLLDQIAAAGLGLREGEGGFAIRLFHIIGPGEGFELIGVVADIPVESPSGLH